MELCRFPCCFKSSLKSFHGRWDKKNNRACLLFFLPLITESLTEGEEENKSSDFDSHSHQDVYIWPLIFLDTAKEMSSALCWANCWSMAAVPLFSPTLRVFYSHIQSFLDVCVGLFSPPPSKTDQTNGNVWMASWEMMWFCIQCRADKKRSVLVACLLLFFVLCGKC